MKAVNAENLPVSLVAAALSCLFSLAVILQNPLLNNDAFIYLRAAEEFSASGLQAALATHGWSAYSILIALCDRVLPGGLVFAAHVVNTASYALLTHAFIAISSEYRDTRRVRWFAALCILGFPLLNEMRYFLIRDTAFWAFALLSLRHLLAFSRDGKLPSGIWWCVSLLAAIAFRLEGLLLLLLAPPTALLAGEPPERAERWRRFCFLLGIAAAGLMLALLFGFLLGLDLPALVGYTYRYYLPLLWDLPRVLAANAVSTSAALFAPENFPGADNTAMGLVVMLFAYGLTLLANIFNALSLPLVVLLVWGWRQRLLHLPAHARWPLAAYVGGSALALLLFVLIMHFMTQRYTTLLSLLLLSLLPLVLDALYERALARDGLRRFHAVLGAFCFYYLVDSLFSFGYSKAYVEEAIAWTKGNLPENARLHTNSFPIAWGSGLVQDYDSISTDIVATMANSRASDYLGLEVKGGERDLRAWLDGNSALELVASFENERGDEVRIYLHRDLK